MQMIHKHTHPYTVRGRLALATGRGRGRAATGRARVPGFCAQLCSFSRIMKASLTNPLNRVKGPHHTCPTSSTCIN